ncbi:MAG: GNAT family N-acetyltransferase [Mucilaginibacter sp.]
MMQNEIIRPIEPKDNTSIAHIIKKVLTEFKANKPGTAYFDKNLYSLSEVFRTPKSWYWVIEQDGEVRGGGGIFPTEGLPDGYCELVKLYLDEPLRGRGIGKKLIALCLQTAADAGYTHVYLETMPELEIAVPLYERLGFNYIETSLGHSGHTDCSTWMVKAVAHLSAIKNN